MTATVGAPDLEAAVEAHRRELTGHCYRMLGSGAEAEDAVQETIIRAWRNIERFEGRSSLRTWLHRIAHNVCVDMVRSPQRRARPMEMGPSRHAPEVVLGEQLGEHHFVQPILDEKVIDLDGDPAIVAEARESIRLAFVAALQLLPPKQRAALILCDVLRWPAIDAAELFETTTASVNSALQRARATLAAAGATSSSDPRPDRSVDQELLDRYVGAFERYDMDELVAVLRADAVLSMPPWDVWLIGHDDIVHWFLNQGLGCRDGRLVPIEVNGGPGFGNYHRMAENRWEPFAIQVIEITGGRISGHHNFIGADFTEYGLPTVLEG